MGCLFLILVLAFPRVVLACLFLFTRYLNHAYNNLVILVLGFLILPLTTLVYAWLVNSGRGTEGINLLFLIVAVIIDLGGLSGSERYRRTTR